MLYVLCGICCMLYVDGMREEACSMWYILYVVCCMLWCVRCVLLTRPTLCFHFLLPLLLPLLCPPVSPQVRAGSRGDAAHRLPQCKLVGSGRATRRLCGRRVRIKTHFTIYTILEYTVYASVDVCTSYMMHSFTGYKWIGGVIYTGPSRCVLFLLFLKCVFIQRVCTCTFYLL